MEFVLIDVFVAIDCCRVVIVIDFRGPGRASLYLASSIAETT